MRKHALLRLCALVTALLLLGATPALAASCALCGNETGSDDYLCTNCLLTLLYQEREDAPLTIDSAVQNADGTVTVTWTDDPANGPYTVLYELLEPAPVPFGWTAAEGVTETSCTLTRLVPGVSYVITVVDGQGLRDEITYFAAVPGTDREIGAKIRLKPTQRIDRSTRKKTAFSASEIAQVNRTEHGLSLKMNYSMLRKTRNYAFTVTAEAPNGFVDVVYSGQITLNYGKSEVPAWTFIEMDEYFGLLERYYGGIPTGEYLVTLYFDGKMVNTTSFEVAQ